MSEAPRLATNPNQVTTPSVQLDALAAIYRRAVERYEESHVKAEEGGPETAPDDGTKLKEDSADAFIIPGR